MPYFDPENITDPFHFLDDLTLYVWGSRQQAQALAQNLSQWF